MQFSTHKHKIKDGLSFPYLSIQRVSFRMKKRNKGGDFGSKMKAFINSYNISASSIPPQTLKPTQNTLKPCKWTLSWSFEVCPLWENKNEIKESNIKDYLT